MGAGSSPPPAPDERVLSMRREFDAPRRLVYEAWTQSEHVRHWWGPRGYMTLSCEMDLRPGGGWRVRSRSPQGTEYTEVGVFREVVPPERLIFTHSWEDLDGKRGQETLVTVTFTELGDRTRVDFRQAEFDSIESRDGHEEGWSSAFELLVEYLAELRA